jgi:hypothetical protein
MIAIMVVIDMNITAARDQWSFANRADTFLPIKNCSQFMWLQSIPAPDGISALQILAAFSAHIFSLP